MRRGFWLIIGAVGFALLVLIIWGGGGESVSAETDMFASTVYLGMWAALLSAGILGSGRKFGDIARQLLVWGVIILALMAGYVFRYDAQDIGSRLTGGIIPGSPISREHDDGSQSVTLIRSPNGHFEADAVVNGAAIRFLVDTGATSVVLSFEDASDVGLNPANLAFTTPVMTANGPAMTARSRIDDLTLGSISRSSIPVTVAKRGALGQSLLGQDFLESLSSYEKRGDRLMLRD